LTKYYDNTTTLLLILRLKIVSTRVGGIPEVLPPELIILTEPNVPCKNIHFDIKITMYYDGKLQ